MQEIDLVPQVYHSLREVELEYREALEGLICHEIPSLDWIQQYENELPEEITCDYYLIFNSQTNAPLGLLSFYLESTEKGFFKRETPSLYLGLKGGAGQGIYLHPSLERKCGALIERILQDYASNFSIKNCTMLSSFPLPFFENKLGADLMEIPFMEGLYKSFSDYKTYIKSLRKPYSQKIITMWNSIRENNIKIECFSSFEEIFTKTDAQEYYHNLIKILPYKLYRKRKGYFLSISQGNKNLGLIVLIPGLRGNLFCNFHPLAESEDLPMDYYFQYSLLKFYELPEFSKLRFLPAAQNFLSGMKSPFLISHMGTTYFYTSPRSLWNFWQSPTTSLDRWDNLLGHEKEF